MFEMITTKSLPGDEYLFEQLEKLIEFLASTNKMMDTITPNNIHDVYGELETILVQLNSTMIKLQLVRRESLKYRSLKFRDTSHPVVIEMTRTTGRINSFLLKIK